MECRHYQLTLIISSQLPIESSDAMFIIDSNRKKIRMKQDLEAENGRPKWNGTMKTDPNSLDIPRTWKKGRLIFVCSMADLFHDDVPLSYIQAVFEVMASTPQHTNQVLTKRAERLEQLSPHLTWPKNVWMGVSVENADYLYRVDHLHMTKAATKFLSLEPLIGPLEHLNLDGIDWVIAGGESGPAARPMPIEWVRSIRDQCVAAGVAFHFKQWGGKNKKKAVKWSRLFGQIFRFDEWIVCRG